MPIFYQMNTCLTMSKIVKSVIFIYNNYLNKIMNQSALICIIPLTVIMSLIPHVSAQEQMTYYIYVDPVPDYATNYASNAINVAIQAWQNTNPDLKLYVTTSKSQANFQVQWLRDTAGESFNGEAFVSSGIIQVALGSSYNCYEKWEPFSENYVDQIMEHEIGHLLGLGHSTDPNNIMYGGLLKGFQYGLIEKDTNLSSGWNWFVPVCTILSETGYSYSVSSSNSNMPFDVYFVPSINEYNKFKNDQSFQYYTNNGCYGKNFIKYSASCQPVAQTSGLIISLYPQIIPTNSLTTVTVNLNELWSKTLPYIPVLPTQQSTVQAAPVIPQPPTPPITGTVSVVGDQFVLPTPGGLPSPVDIIGHLNNAQGGQVSLSITMPDDTVNIDYQDINMYGDFSYALGLTSNSEIGEYSVAVFYANNWIGTTKFIVASSANSYLTQQTIHTNANQYTISAYQNIRFSPETITIPVGSTVTWTNNDNSLHNIQIQFPNNQNSITALLDGTVISYSHTFDQIGTYTYYDEIHPSMKGIIMVGESTVPEFNSLTEIIITLSIISVVVISSGSNSIFRK